MIEVICLYIITVASIVYILSRLNEFIHRDDMVEFYLVDKKRKK